MNTLNLKIINALYTIILLSLVTTACGGKADSNNKSDPAPGSSNAPTVSISATPTSVTYNTSTSITWTSTNSTSCSSSGGGGTGTSGSFNTGALTSTTTYTVTCVGAGGSASQGKTITVAPSAITGFSGTVNVSPVTVISVNNLTPGAMVTISGMNSYNATYTVVSATSNNFVLAIPFVSGSGSETGTWQLAGGMSSGCSTTTVSGNGSAITLSNVPSRFNGVAPLAVFFDATLTATVPVTPRPFHDLEYRWNFGNPAGSPVSGAAWGNGSKAGVSSRNAATGPVAAHVYENPGVYTVALTATDGTNTVSNRCAQIVVQDPDIVFAGTNTVCVGATILPVQNAGGCPAGASTVLQSNFATAVNTYALTGKRVLFKRGDTFTESTSARINRTGPGIVGAFGTGAKPLIQSSVITLQLSSQETPGIKDWRVMDLEFAGQSGPVAAINADGGINQVTLLRLDGHDYTDTFDFNFLVLDWHNSHGFPGHALFDEITIVDSTMRHVLNGGMGSFIAAQRFAFLGNLYDDAASGAGQHIMRITYNNKGVISNSTLGRAAAGRHVLKLHGPMQGEIGITNPTGNSYTEKVVLSDNRFIGGDSVWTVSIEPQNAVRDERLRDIIVERNWFDGTNSGQATAMLISANEATIRNNICDMTGALDHQCIRVVQRGVEPPPTNIRIYNNTIYSGSTGNFYAVTIDSTATNVTVKNNLGSAPSASSPTMISGTGASGFVQLNNLLNNNPAQLFVNASVSDFRLIALPNPARDMGLSTVPVFSDFLSCFACRPQSGVTGVIDIGAIEGP